MHVENSLQNRFVFLISLFDLSAILKIRNGEHAHYVGLVVAYTWNREKQMFVALGKEFDMGRYRGMLFRAASIFVVFLGDAEPRKLHKFI